MKSLGLIGKKIGMTSVFTDDGRMVPVTVIQAGPCPVMQVKTDDNDGYNALQIAFGAVAQRKLNKPARGHQEKVGKGLYRKLKEIRLSDVSDYEAGQDLTVELFSIGDKVKISGRSKGRGFAGVIKRWNFGGSPDTHGHHKVHRTPGAIGQCADPARVFKGKKMPGRMGNTQTTYKNLEVVDVRSEENLILVKGQVPGPRNATVTICKQ